MFFGIDPGERLSGVVIFDSVSWVVREAKPEFINTAVEAAISSRVWDGIICEDVVPMGVPFSCNLRLTCRAIDRFEYIAEEMGIPWYPVKRNDVKVVLCGRCRGIKDSNVVCAVQERFGGRIKARGTKERPGPCWGVAGHAWQALAAVLVGLEQRKSDTVS